MHLPDEKLDVVKAFIDTDDEALLQQLNDALENGNRDIRDSFPDYMAHRSTMSKMPTNAEFLASHEEVMKSYFEFL